MNNLLEQSVVFTCNSKTNHWLLPRIIQMSKRWIEQCWNMRTGLKTKMEFASHSFVNVLKATYLWMNCRFSHAFI